MHKQSTHTIEELEERVADIFVKSGVSDISANALAKVIVAGERDGCASHGLYRIEGCLRTIKAGKVDPSAQPHVMSKEGAIVKVDAQMGFSNPAFYHGLPHLLEKTHTHGLAAMVILDCTHFSALWHEVEAITEAGLAGLALCPSYATVAPFGGTEPLLGTNPIAFGWPRPARDPYVFDFATSMVARGEIELHRRAGKTLPDGWAVDNQGNPTTIPEEALSGAMLPFGAHKGSAISTMIELLAGAMIGDLTSPEALEVLGTTTLAPRHGELILAFDPVRFAAGRTENPFDRAEILLTALAGQARLPSERRFSARKVAQTEGITLSAEAEAMLNKMQKEGLNSVSL